MLAENGARRRLHRDVLGAADRPQPPVWSIHASTAVSALALGIAGFVCSRILPPLIGRGVETLRLLLVVVACALGLGSLLHTLTRGGRRRMRSNSLAARSAAVALGLAVPYALGDNLAIFALLLRPLADAEGSLRLLGQLLVVSAVVLPAAVAWGYLLAGLVSRGGPKQLGLAGVAGSVGLIVGFFASSGLVTRLSVIGLWQGTAALMLTLALLFAILSWRSSSPALTALLSLILLTTGLLLATREGPSVFWRHAPIDAGQPRSTMTGLNDLKRLLNRQRRAIVWAVDGARSGVALAVEDGYTLRLDGRPKGGLRDAPGAVMSGLIGAALHAAPETALVIGLGDGVSAGWLATVPSIQRVDVAEAELVAEHIADFFATLNRDVLSSPKVRLIRRSGRDLLRSATEPYDLILVNDAGRADRRLWTTAASRLGEDALLLLRLRETDPATERTILDGLTSVFPSVESWQVQADGVVLVATAKPLAHDLERLGALMTEEPYRQALDKLWGVQGLEGLLTGHLSDLTGMKVDRTTVEDLRRARDLTWSNLPHTADPSSLQAYQRGDLRQALLQLTLLQRTLFQRAQLQQGPNRQAANSPMERLLLAESLAEFADDRVPELARTLRAQRPVEADAVLARWHVRRQSTPQAAHSLITAFDSARTNPWVFRPTLGRALTLAEEISSADTTVGAELFAALAEPFAVHLLDEARLQTRVAIAALLDDEASRIEAFEAFEPYPPWDYTFLLERWRCYQHTKPRLAEQARRDLQTFLDAAPPSLEAGLLPSR